MGTLFIKVKCDYKESYAVENVIRYSMGKKKSKERVRYCGSRGVPTNVELAADRMIRLQQLYKKDKGRRIYQMIVSFPRYIRDVRLVKRVAEAISDYLFQEFQVVYGIHEDTNQLHIHFGINPVNYKTKKKWHKSKTDFAELKQDILEIVNEILGTEKYEMLTLKKER